MTVSRSQLRETIQRRTQKRRRHAQLIGLGSLVVIILLGAAIWMSSAAASQPVAHQVSYDASLVSNDHPLRAVHEMTGPSLASIPFLPDGGPQPQIVISDAFFDFKQVGSTEVVQHEFVIANQGDAPLTISRAYTSCECTTADFTATIIPPGGISIVTLTFDAGVHDVAGQTVRRGIMIESNDPANPQMEIWTQASVGLTP